MSAPSPNLNTVPEAPPFVLRRGSFDLDLRSGELRRSGVLLHLQPQPFKVLALLAGRPGDVVTREEIQHEVWPDGTFVDFEQSLNFCIRQIRSVLGDSALSPRFVETLPRRGYRWIGPVGPSGPAEAAAPAEARVRWTPVLVALVLASSLAIGYWALWRPSAPPLPSFHRVTFRRGVVDSARFSPDGQVVYAASWDGGPSALYATGPQTRESRTLESGDSRVVAVSRNGEVAFLSKRTLARASLAGGPAKEILDGVVAADATPDGSAFAVVRRVEGRPCVEYPVGTVLCPAVFPSHLRLSPRGDRVAFLEHPVHGDDRGQVAMVDRAGKKTTLSAGWASIEGLAWSPRGDEVWFTGTRVGADLSLHAVSLEGRERMLAPALGRLVLHDVSPEGRVLLARVLRREELRFRSADEPQERDLSWLDLSMVNDISRDGRFVLFGESGEGAGPDYEVYLRRTDGSPPVRLGHGRPMGLSPDGKWVLAIPVSDASHIEMLPTGPGEVRVLRDEGITTYESAGWFPDGESIFFTAVQPDGQRRSFRRPLSGAPPQPITPTGVTVFRQSLSPAGRTVVAPCGERFCLYPVDGGEPAPIPGLDPGQFPLAWGDSERSLLLTDMGQGSGRVYHLDVVTGRKQLWRDLSPADRAGIRGISALYVTPDGRALAYSSLRCLSDLYVVDGLR